MPADDTRVHRAGQDIDDLCRACKAVRVHTVMATDAQGGVLRVVCGFCGSEHNYRGGGGDGPRRSSPARVGVRLPVPRLGTGSTPVSGSEAAGRSDGALAGGEPGRNASDVERVRTPMSESDGNLEDLLRRVIREELGLTPVGLAERWRGGEMVLRPGKPGLQEKKWPLDGFFHKIVMIRNRLRTLEQQVNASELPEDAKVRLQSYVTGCYGSLTSFNLLFADEADQFKGSSTD